MFEDAPGYSYEVDMYVFSYNRDKIVNLLLFQMGMWRNYVHPVSSTTNSIFNTICQAGLRESKKYYGVELYAHISIIWIKSR